MQPALRMIAILAIAMLSGGCANYRRMKVSPPPQTRAEKNFDAVWRASLEVLRRYHFPIDRCDRRAGLITTGKIVGRHWFEFWRRDAATGYDLAEGSLQTVHRSVRVRIAPSASRADEFSASVEVIVSRPNRQNLEIIAAGAAA